MIFVELKTGCCAERVVSIEKKNKNSQTRKRAKDASAKSFVDIIAESEPFQGNLVPCVSGRGRGGDGRGGRGLRKRQKV